MVPSRWCIGLAFLAFLAPDAQARAQAGAPAPKIPPTRDSLNAITVRGQLLAQYDYVAALASDSVVAHKPVAGTIDGYVGRLRGTRWDFAFGKPNTRGDTFFVAFEVRQRADDPDRFDVASFTPARADTGYYPRALRALALAKTDFGQQQRPYNAALLERPAGTFWVYLMPAQTRHGVFPLGGDVRYLVDRDGRTVLAKRQLHKAIIENGPPAPGQDKLVAGTHVAIMDDIPEDTDVFHVLVREPSVPEYVLTDAFVYHISTNGDIRYLGKRSEVLGDKPTGAP